MSLSSLKAQYTVTLDSTVLTVDTVVSGLDVPWEIVMGPDNDIWFTERHGKISKVDIETGQRKVLLDHRGSVYQFNESGMLGLMLHPNFTTNPWVYVAYTYVKNSTVKERISRFTYSNDSLTGEEILIEDIPGNTTHDGCRFLLLPDNTVIFTTGDARKDTDAQKVDALNGKVLRMTLDGKIPADNPNPNSYVWSWGHRNAQGLTLGPMNKIYSSEHGPTSDDELNILSKGRNFGWPNVEGMCNSAIEKTFCQDSNVVEPIFSWTPTIAPSDLIYYNHPAIPEFNNTLVMTVLKTKEIVTFKLDANGETVSTAKSYFKQEFGRLRDICADSEGVIYLATNGASWSNTDPNTHVILRLRNMKFIGVEDKPKSSGHLFEIFPNPSSGSLNIQATLANINSVIKVLDSQGRMVDEIQVESGRTSYNSAHLQSGYYILEMNEPHSSQSTKWLHTGN